MKFLEILVGKKYLFTKLIPGKVCDFSLCYVIRKSILHIRIIFAAKFGCVLCDVSNDAQIGGKGTT